MTVWAIADLHLAISVPEKDMAFFGPAWENYAEKIARNWREKVAPNDLVLIAGDITWAMRPEQAEIDLKWIDALPGTKVMIRGNHDYWWSSLSKVKKIAPPSIHFLQHTPFNRNDVTISGTRLWDTDEFNFNNYIEFQDNPRQNTEKPQPDPKIFERELGRLELACKALDPTAATKIIMTHYPPISATLEPSRASAILDQYDVDICIFGHLHNLKTAPPFGTLKKTTYILTSADVIDFTPILVL